MNFTTHATHQIEGNEVHVELNEDSVSARIMIDGKISEWFSIETLDNFISSSDMAELDMFECHCFLPEEMTAMLGDWEQQCIDGFTGAEITDFEQDCNRLGYTFDYGLSMEPYHLRKIKAA